MPHDCNYLKRDSGKSVFPCVLGNFEEFLSGNTCFVPFRKTYMSKGLKYSESKTYEIQSF